MGNFGKDAGLPRLPLVGGRHRRTHDQKPFLEGRRLRDDRASRWSALNGIVETTKFALDMSRPSHGSRAREQAVCGFFQQAPSTTGS